MYFDFSCDLPFLILVWGNLSVSKLCVDRGKWVNKNVRCLLILWLFLSYNCKIHLSESASQALWNPRMCQWCLSNDHLSNNNWLSVSNWVSSLLLMQNNHMSFEETMFKTTSLIHARVITVTFFMSLSISKRGRVSFFPDLLEKQFLPTLP